MALSCLVIDAHLFINKYLFICLYVCMHVYLDDDRTPRVLENVKMDVRNALNQNKRSHLITLLT